MKKWIIPLVSLSAFGSSSARAEEHVLYHVTAFASHPDEGNKAAVAIDFERVLRPDQMKEIAIAKAYPESVFVHKGEKESDFEFEFYSQGGEQVPFCGHASIAALQMLKQLSLAPLGKDLKIRTLGGDFTMRITPQEFQIDFEKITMDLAPEPLKSELSKDLFPKELLNTNLPLRIHRELKYLYIPIRSIKALNELNPDPVLGKEFSRQHGINILYAFTVENGQLHSRSFAPILEVNEDPFTGSAQGGLAAYVAFHNLLPGKKIFESIQGEKMGQVGKARLTPSIENNQLMRVTLHAEAVYLKEEIYLFGVEVSHNRP